MDVHTNISFCRDSALVYPVGPGGGQFRKTAGCASPPDRIQYRLMRRIQHFGYCTFSLSPHFPSLTPIQFAATMWVIDAGLQFATNNFSAIYIHTREFQIQYNLFDPPSPSTPTLSGWRTGSPYYAVLLLAETFSSSGSVVVDLNLENSLTDPSATVAGYGIYDNGGASRGKLVLFNRADAGGALRTFSIPANVSSGQPIGVRLLRAPSVYERTEISWAGQTIGPTGELEGERTTEYLDCADGCDVSVPGPGVALVYLDPNATDTDSFYDGNSTVAAGGDARADSSSRVSALRCGQWFGVLLGIVGVLSLL